MLIIFISIPTTLLISLWTHSRQRMFSRMTIFLIFLNILISFTSFIFIFADWLRGILRKLRIPFLICAITREIVHLANLRLFRDWVATSKQCCGCDLTILFNSRRWTVTWATQTDSTKPWVRWWTDNHGSTASEDTMPLSRALAARHPFEQGRELYQEGKKTSTVFSMLWQYPASNSLSNAEI